jgi:deoxyribonuclease V
VIAAVDVDYRTGEVVAACVMFADWQDAAPLREIVTTHAGAPAPYEPGAFYKRELPYLTGLFAGATMIVIDGYVWLGADRPGLGAHVHDATGVPVVGVAKRPFAGAEALAVVRGRSTVPLHVTAIGCDPVEAAANVRAMHGPFRIPTLLKRVDQLCRELVRPADK